MKIFEKRPLALILCIIVGGFSFFADYDIKCKLIIAAVALAIISAIYIFEDLKRCRNKISVIGDYNIDTAAFDEGPDMRLFEREHLEGVIRYAKSALSDYEYSVLIYHMHGYKTAQIAERLGKTSKSVDNAKARVFRRLREASKDIP